MNGWNWDGPILDHHMHLDNMGMGVEAARTFKSAGGTSLILVHKPNFDSLPENKDDYRAAYSKTLDMAESVRKKLESTSESFWAHTPFHGNVRSIKSV